MKRRPIVVVQSDLRKIGTMPASLMQQVDAALKASLELP